MGLLVSGLFLAQTVGAATLQVVNDSGRSADEVYLLLSGQDLSATATQWHALKTPLHLVDLDGTPPATTCAQPLSSWPKQGTTTSPRTSRTLDVYEVPIADKITSGRLWVAYGPANAVTGGKCEGFLQFSGSAAPKNTASYRYDKMEMTYDGSQWYANLTSLDFLAIPMQLETVDGSGTVTDQRSFQTSLTSLRQRVTDLFGSAAITGAGSDFLRIYGPGTLTTDVNADTGSPAPYPSFATYLASLV
ncbi:MAG: beta-1,3-glucanase family protein, partial [Halothiobacillaceae bacterium]